MCIVYLNTAVYILMQEVFSLTFAWETNVNIFDIFPLSRKLQ